MRDGSGQAAERPAHPAAAPAVPAPELPDDRTIRAAQAGLTRGVYPWGHGAPVTRLRLRVSPGAGRSEIVGRHGDAWRVRVAAAPERGKANASVVELLAGVSRSGAAGRSRRRRAGLAQ